VKRLYRLGLTAIAVAVFIAATDRCKAETPCPWLNAATAGGFLGGEVKATVPSFTTVGDATCEFTRSADGSSSMLRIAVHTMTNLKREFSGYLAECGGNATPLRGIGNEAVQCIPASGAAKGDELIIGRVRDRAFIITIKADWIKDPPSTPAKTRNPISDESENLAEQVAGALF
jgi:hypothetical protein